MLVPRYITAGVVRQGRHFDAREAWSLDSTKPGHIEFPPGRYRVSYVFKDVSAARPDEPQKVVHFGDIATNEVEFDVVEGDAVSSSGFAAKLANGVIVELVGVCEHPSEGKQWWRPDGTILKQSPYDHTPSIVHPDDTQQALEMTVRISGSGDINASAIWNIPDATYSSSSSTVRKGDDVAKGLQGVTFVCPESIKESDLSIGIAAGPWNTISSRPANTIGSHSESKLIWHLPYEKDGKTIIAVAYSYKGDVRITAVPKKGESITAGSSTHNVEGFSGMEARFNLPLDKIKEFQFQTRPYQWITFKNVSLRPGVKTDVQVED